MEIHVNICTSQSNKSIFKKKKHIGPKTYPELKTFTHETTDISSSSLALRSTEDPGLQQDQFTDVSIPS